jgi:LuxR family transcriptional regulator, maltose regulon positive regulatory protein
VAPPGYGKTTALAQWAARDGRQFAWVSLDHRDNDPVVFLTYVAEALNADGTVEPAVFKALTGPDDSVWTSGLPRLGVALASRPEPLVLVLDDVHELENHGCLDALVALLPHVPRGSQLVLSGRTEVRLGLPKLRADGELLELGPPALALNDAEALALVAAAGVDVTEAEAEELNEHVEGWAAGLYLAALSLDGGTSSLATFGGDDRFVTDYLRSEELANVEPAELDFLLRTSILDRMCASLCDALLERDDSGQMLERLEHDNLFVVPLDHQRRGYRYHHLFREMLQAELRRREPELQATLNRRAASWCEANGQPEVAIEYSAAAGDTDAVARLVTACAFPYYRSGLVTTLERWLEMFDDPALLERYPAIGVFGIWVHALRGRPDEAERWALTVETSSPFKDPMPDGSPFEAWAAMVRALLCRDGVERMQIDAELAVSSLSPASPWRPASVLLHGVAVLFAGDLDRAEVILDQAAEAAVAAGAVWVGVVACSERALLAFERGDLLGAESELARAGAFVDDAPSAEYVVTAILLAVTARVAIAKGQGARARQTLVSAQRLRPTLTHALSWFAVQAQLELAKAHLALSDARGAATLLQEANDILRRRSKLGTLVTEAEDLGAQVSLAKQSSGWPSTLTAAELRLLPLLTTHLTFREIAERLYVSRNTVKTQAISAYRKLDASSRSEAIERAIELGLVDASPASLAVEFTRSG